MAWPIYLAFFLAQIFNNMWSMHCSWLSYWVIFHLVCLLCDMYLQCGCNISLLVYVNHVFSASSTECEIYIYKHLAYMPTKYLACRIYMSNLGTYGTYISSTYLTLTCKVDIAVGNISDIYANISGLYSHLA